MNTSLIVILIYSIIVMVNMYLESENNELSIGQLMLSLFGPFHLLSLTLSRHSKVSIWRKK